MHKRKRNGDTTGILARVWLCRAVLAACALMWSATAVAQPIPISSCGTISVSGSYVLTQNLTSRFPCLIVTADSVTIDLDGFSIVASLPIDDQSSGPSKVLDVHGGMMDGGFGGSIRVICSSRSLVSATDLTLHNITMATSCAINTSDRTVVRVARVQSVQTMVSGNFVTEVVESQLDLHNGFTGAAVRNSTVISPEQTAGFAIKLHADAPDAADSSFFANRVEGSIVAGDNMAGIFAEVSPSLLIDNVATGFTNGFVLDGASLLVNDLGGGNSGRGFVSSPLISWGGVGKWNALFGDAAFRNGTDGIDLLCPGFVVGSTALDNVPNLTESGAGCLNADNLAP